MRQWLRYDGYRVKSQGRSNGVGVFISYGWLCHKDRNSDSDPRVAIYFISGVGYFYKEV